MAIQKYTNYYEWISSKNNNYAGGPFSSYNYRNLNINDFKTELENLFSNQTVYFNTIQFGFYYKSAVTSGDYDFRIDSNSIETKTNVGSTVDKYFDTNYASKCSAIGVPTSSIQLGVKSSAYQVHYSKFKIKWYPKFPIYITSSDGAIYDNNYDMGTVLSFSAANRLGYTFSKWTDNDTSLSRTITVNGQITLAAEYTPNIYTITLKNQSATTPGISTLYLKYNTGWYSDSVATISISSITIPTKTGYIFGGYYTSTNGTGAQIIDSNGNINSGYLTFTTTNNTSLYAKWIPITYSVSYNSNGGSGSINNTTVTYDNYYSNNVLAENTFTKFGYDFKEWNTKSDGSGTGYASGFILSDNLTTVQNAVIPLYAIWKKKPLVMFDTIFSFIDWKRQGIIGSNATVSKDLITDIGFTLTSNTGTGEGTAASHYFPVTAGQSYKIDIDIEGNNWDVYIFFHNETSSGTGIDFNDRNNRYSSTDTNSSYQIFKAPNTATKAQIRVDANGSNNTVKFSNFRIYPSNYYHMNNSILANERTIMDNWDFPDNPLRSDVFEFIGWNTSPDGQGDNYDINSTFPENEDKILYSQWKKISYRAFAGNKLIKPAFLSKNKKIEKIFVGTTEV